MGTELLKTIGVALLDHQEERYLQLRKDNINTASNF